MTNGGGHHQCTSLTGLTQDRLKQVPNNTGIKGVHFRNGRYHAGIKVNQKRIHLGVFDDLDDAADAYRLAALKYFGDFANV